MQIVEPDFTMKLSNENSNKFDLTFNKKVKKRDTGKFEIEPGDTLYGLTLSSCLNRIAHHRTAKKWEEENVALKEFLKEYLYQHNLLIKLCKESIPENFDTGE